MSVGETSRSPQMAELHLVSGPFAKKSWNDVAVYSGVTGFLARLFGAAIEVPLHGNRTITVDVDNAREYLLRATGLKLEKKDIAGMMTSQIYKKFSESETFKKDVTKFLELKGPEVNRFAKEALLQTSRVLYTPETIFVRKEVLQDTIDQVEKIGIRLEEKVKNQWMAKAAQDVVEISASEFEKALKSAQVDQRKLAKVADVQDKQLKQFLKNVVQMVEKPRGAVSEKLHKWKKEVASIASQPKTGASQQRSRELLQEITGIKRSSAPSQANYCQRLLEAFNGLSAKERADLKNLCLKSGYFTGDQLKELQQL